MTVVPDALHIFDIGVLHHILGNGCFFICFLQDWFPGQNTPEQKCDALWKRIVRQYRGRGTQMQIGNLTPAMFADLRAPRAHFPCLTSTIKAAESRALLLIISDFFHALHLHSSIHPEEAAIDSMLASADQMYTTMR